MNLWHDFGVFVLLACGLALWIASRYIKGTGKRGQAWKEWLDEGNERSKGEE